MSKEIETLHRKSLLWQMLQSNKLKETALLDLSNKAEQFGYSIEYWKNTKIWRKHSEITESLHTLNTASVELEKKPETQRIPQFSECPKCQKVFKLIPKNKRFCSKKCKDDFNNDLKRTLKNK